MRKHSLSYIVRQMTRLAVACLLATLLVIPLDGAQAQRRGSFGGGSFGGGSRSSGGSFGGGRSSGGSFGGGLFGGSRSSSGSSFGSGSRSSGSFGNSGSFGSGRSASSSSGGGSFGRSGSFGGSAGIPSSSSYRYGGNPYGSVHYYGGWNDYSYAWGAPAWYYWTPFHPAFYYNPPIYVNGGYEPGGFSFLHFLISIVFFLFIFWLIGKLIFGRKGVRYTSY